MLSRSKEILDKLIDAEITHKVRKDRLLVLVDYLERVYDESFNMAHWQCGTTACAAGHACNIPEFKKAGLRVYHSNIKFEDFEGFDAVKAFFGLSWKLSLWLFQGSSYSKPTRRNVISRIRNVISYCENRSRL